MPVVSDIKVEGLRELEARLLELDAVAGKKLMLRATRRSLLPLRRQAVANAQRSSRSGGLAQAIKIVTVTPKAGETVQVQVGPKKKDRRGVALHNVYYRRKLRGIFYGHLLEFGHRTGTRSTGYLQKWRRGKFGGAGGTGRGIVPARPWLGPAWDATRNSIPAEFRRILGQALDRIAGRARQRSTATERLVDP